MNLFPASIKARSNIQPQLAGVTLSGMELTENHRFSSSELNLAFEGLLLEASIHVLAEATRSDPC
jgi:hypothetical protein